MKLTIQAFAAKLHASRFHVAAILPIYICLSWVMDSWFAGGAFALAVVYSADRLHARYALELARRIQLEDGPKWEVEVNQVKAGTITDAHYAEIRFQVFHDFRTYVAQATNLLWVAFSFFSVCLTAIPVSAFWIAVGLAMFAPDSITALQAASAADIAQAISNGARMLPIVMLLSLIVNVLLGLNRFGFANQFERAVGVAIRKQCGVVAEGSIVLVRWTLDGPAFADEMAWLLGPRKT